MSAKLKRGRKCNVKATELDAKKHMLKIILSFVVGYVRWSCSSGGNRRGDVS